MIFWRACFSGGVANVLSGKQLREPLNEGRAEPLLHHSVVQELGSLLVTKQRIVEQSDEFTAMFGSHLREKFERRMGVPAMGGQLRRPFDPLFVRKHQCDPFRAPLRAMPYPVDVQ